MVIHVVADLLLYSNEAFVSKSETLKSLSQTHFILVEIDLNFLNALLLANVCEMTCYDFIDMGELPPWDSQAETISIS